MVVLQNRVATFCWVSLVIMLTFSHVAHASKQPNLRTACGEFASWFGAHTYAPPSKSIFTHLAVGLVSILWWDRQIPFKWLRTFALTCSMRF